MTKPNINSPLGRRELAMQNPGRKVYTVPDESEYFAESTEDDFEIPKNAKIMQDPEISSENIVNPVLKRKMQQESLEKQDSFSRENLAKFRQESRQKKLEVSPKAKERLEFLIGLKKKTEDVVVEGVVFTLKTLKHSEYQKVFAALAGMPETTGIAVSLEVQVQTLARAITHIEKNNVFEVLGVETQEQIVECLREFDNDVIEELYNKYQKLKQPLKVQSSEEEEVRENLKK